MTEQFQNQEAEKLTEMTDSDAPTEKRIDHLAEKTAEKSTKTEQHYDKKTPLFSK